MSYTVGSIADLISGKNTPNKPKVELQKVKAKPFQIKKEPIAQENDSPKKLIKKEKKFSPEKSKSPEKTPQKRKGDVPNFVSIKKVKTEEDESKPESENSKNAKKRMRDTKKERLVDPEKDARTIFIGNVPISTKKGEIIKFFTQYGKVESIRFRCTARANLKLPKKAAFITKQLHPKVLTANVYLIFKEKESVTKALEANGQLFKGNHLRVDSVTKTNTDREQKKSVFIGNIPFDAKDEDLWKIFESIGQIESVRLVRDGITRMGKGYGYVNFKTQDAVELALQMTDVKIKNRELRIKRYTANSNETKKRNEKGEKNRKVPRQPNPDKKKKVKKPKKDIKKDIEDSEKELHVKDETEETTEDFPRSPKKETKQENFQGTKFTDKKKKKKQNKTLLKQKKISKMLTPAKKTKTVEKKN